MSAQSHILSNYKFSTNPSKLQRFEKPRVDSWKSKIIVLSLKLSRNQLLPKIIN